MAITAPDISKLRNSKSQWVTLTLNRVPLLEVATARVNQTTFTHTTNQLTVDTASADWTTKVKRGMRLCVGTTAGAWDVFSSTIKETPTSTLVKFGAVSQGDSGYATDIRVPLADNLYVTVYADRPPWSNYSAIRNKVFYKNYDEAYTNQNSQPAPIVNIGHHRQVTITGATTQLTFPDVSVTPIPWGSATITDFAWSCATATPVGDEDGEFVTYEFEPGFHIVELEVTDSNSKTNSAFRYVWVNHATLYPPVTAPWADLSAPTDQNGLKMRLALYGNFTSDDIYPGQAWMLTENSYFDGVDLDEPEQRVSQFFGYLPEINVTRTPNKPSIDLTIESPLTYARRMGAVSQLMVEKTSPANWTQVTSTLSNPVGAFFYILHYHAPNILAGHDFLFAAALKTLRKQSFDFPRGTIGAQLEFIQQLIPGNIGSRADGSMVMAALPHYLDNTARNLLDDKFEWNETDIVGQLSWQRTFAMQTRQVKVGVLSYTGGTTATAKLCQAPGAVEAQGGSDESEIDVIVPSSLDLLTRGKELAGHHFAYKSARALELPMNIRRNMDIIEPADCSTFHLINASALYDPYGEGLVNRRYIPIRVNRSYRLTDRKTISKTISVDWEFVTYGLPGIDITPVRSGAASQVDNGVIIQTLQPLDQQIRTAFALTFNGLEFARTNSFNNSFPAWSEMPDVFGVPCDAAPNYNSEYFLTGVGELWFWLLLTDDADLKIYHVQVRVGEVTATLQKIYTMADETVTTSARIRSSKTTPDFCAVAFKDGTGTLIGRTEDGGETWEDLVRAGNMITDDASNDNALLGFDVLDTAQVVSAPVTFDEWHLYKATGTGSFTQITDSVGSLTPHPMVAFDNEGTLYATVVPIPPDVNDSVNITFDDGGTAYVTTNTVSSGGNPGNAAQRSIVGENGTRSVAAEQDPHWTTPQTITSISLQFKNAYVSGGFSSSSSTVEFQYYDTSGSLISTNTFAWNTLGYSNNTWITCTDPSPPANVGYVIFKVNIFSSGGVTTTLYLDNCVANI